MSNDDVVAGIERSGLFDYEFYKSQAGTEGSRRELVRHYLETGRARGLRASSDFDPEFYAQCYPDVVEAGAELFEHYALHGRHEGRYPNRAALYADVHTLRVSGLFDEPYYRARHAGALSEEAIERYLIVGARFGHRPRPDFDPAFYTAYYPDWSDQHNPFVHYILNRRRQWIFRNLKEASQFAEAVRKSPLFDEEYYREHYFRENDDIDPAVHYCTYGFRKGFNPSATFDTQYYLTAYKDIRDARINPLWHFEVAGRSEGRSGFSDLAMVTSPGQRPFDPEKPTVLICCHDSNRTGAPILGLNLAAYLSRDYNVLSWLGRDGTLREDFARFSYLMVVVPVETARASSQTETVLRRQRLDFAILNSVESTLIAPALWRADVPVVSLIHEFAQYTFPRGKLSRAVLLSDQVVVPAGIVRESLLHELRTFLVDTEPAHLATRPQGRSILGTGMPAEGDLAREEILARLGIDPAMPQAERPFVILGAGWVQPRKGVELFIAAARQFKAMSDRDVRFAWVGGNYDPVRDIQYSVWLRDEIERSGLDNHVVFFEEQGSLEAFWTLADAFFLSSRLDPFPNVVLDALAHDTPVVCFERATGAAEWAERTGRIAAVPYLDTRAAAEELLRIAESNGLPDPTISAETGALLDFSAYVDAVKAYGARAREIAAARIADQAAIEESGLFDSDFFASACPQWITEDLSFDLDVTPYLKLYTTLAHRGIYPAKSRRGFNDRVYAANAGLAGGCALAVAARAEDTAVTHPMIRLSRASAAPAAPSVAVHIHLHYEDLAPEIFEQLVGADVTADLFVSTTSSAKAEMLETVFSSYQQGRVHVVDVPNRGRDIGPFLVAWGRRWLDYDVVGHLHGKKSADLGSTRGTDWRHFVLERLVGDRRTWHRLMSAFVEDPELGLIFPEDPNIIGWTENRAPAEALLERLGLGLTLPEAIEFPLGNMFWARPAALAPLIEAGLGWEDFPAEPVAYDGTVLHALERVLPLVCEATGHTWRTVDKADRPAAAG